MRRVKLKTVSAGPEGAWPAGAVVIVSDGVGEMLVAGGYAEWVADPPAVLKDEGVETATAEPVMERAVGKRQRKADV